MNCDSKDIFKKAPCFRVSCTNAHHDITDLVNHGMVKIQKLEYLENRHKIKYEIKKFLTSASDGTF